jgi:hypothetical protein
MRLTGFNSPSSLALITSPLWSVAASFGLGALIACGGVGFDPLEDGTTGDSTTAEETGGWRPGQGKDSEPPDTGPINPIPQISRFAAHEDGDKVRFFFTLDDEDDNMTGGSVTLRFDTRRQPDLRLPRPGRRLRQISQPRVGRRSLRC